MDRLERILQEHFQGETYACTDAFCAKVLATPRKNRCRLHYKGILAVAAVCAVMALGVAAGGFRLFYPGVGFAEGNKGTYYIAEQTMLGAGVVDSAIYADGALTVWMLYDYHETEAPEVLQLRCGEDIWQAEADGLYDYSKAGAGEAVYTFVLDAMPMGELVLTDGERESVLSMTGETPVQTFTLGNDRYAVTLAQLTPESRLLAAQMEVVTLDPIAAEAKVVSFDLSDDSLWQEGHESRAYTDAGEYILYSGTYGMRYFSPAGLADMEERNDAGMHFSTGSRYMMLQLEEIGAQGSSDVFTLDSPIRAVKIDRLQILARSHSVGYPTNPAEWADTAFDQGQIVIPARNGGKVALVAPVTLQVGTGLELVLHTVERVDREGEDSLYIDFDYTAEAGVEIERLELVIPGWYSYGGTLEEGRIWMVCEDEEDTDGAKVPIGLFGVGYSVVVG